MSTGPLSGGDEYQGESEKKKLKRKERPVSSSSHAELPSFP